jgi:release factor glutamine methyltransferase
MSSHAGKVWTVVSMLEWGTGYFREKGVDNPRLSMEWLLADLLNVRRLDIYLQHDRPLSPSELEQLKPLIKRRANHEPLQHITGSAEFMGLTFSVNKHVLIPRAETEQLVELILNENPAVATKGYRVLDLGTGSGCIPISLKNYRPEWYCAACDISEEALAIASGNSVANNAEIELFRCDIHNLAGDKDMGSARWDIVVSNPPYIKPEEKMDLDPQVRDYEPELALFHETPLKLYKTIAEFAASKSARLYLELNNKLADEIKVIVAELFGQVDLISDYDNNPRFISAKKAL